MIKNESVVSWIDQMKKIFKPSKSIWIEGDEKQNKFLRSEAIKLGVLTKLDQDLMPECYLHRSSINDVARSEERTFMCSETKEEVGPNNNWWDPKESFEKLMNISKGSYNSKTMYIIPFAMGPLDSSMCQFGVQITDSIYVAIMMSIMTKINKDVYNKFNSENLNWIKCIHASCKNDFKNRFICHFPQKKLIFSINSNYGGNALLGKKCLALRMASVRAKKEGWLAEHMAIIGIERPGQEIIYICVCFPSGCGKSDTAMLKLPDTYKKKGYKVWCVGDDIAWLKIDNDGYLKAVNAENGFFGACSSINNKTNVSLAIKKDTVFTNMMYDIDKNIVWMDGLNEELPKNAINWKGEIWKEKLSTHHPNARFAAPLKNYPYMSKEINNPEGVPISAIVFGGKRSNLMPLVFKTHNWEHGVFIGSILSTQTTDAIDNNKNEIRRDPFSMLAFCGYNMSDYFKHWLDMGKILGLKAPKIFNINLFRCNKNKEIIWPGFGENIRIFEWILDNLDNKNQTKVTKIGLMPFEKDINIEGLNISPEDKNILLNFDENLWLDEKIKIKDFYKKFNNSIPSEFFKFLN